MGFAPRMQATGNLIVFPVFTFSEDGFSLTVEVSATLKQKAHEPVSYCLLSAHAIFRVPKVEFEGSIEDQKFTMERGGFVSFESLIKWVKTNCDDQLLFLIHLNQPAGCKRGKKVIDEVCQQMKNADAGLVKYFNR